MSGEDSWVFDSLVCFLHGPVWNAPLQTFIEEKSLRFDPNIKVNENDACVKQIYEDYKNLVDYMLGSFMEELQITPEQFERACQESRQQHQQSAIPFHFHQGLFQQIWAANDINIFIRMMTQRNVELQLQALDLIEKNQLPLLQEGEQDGGKTSPTNKGRSQSEKLPAVEDFIVKSLEKELQSPEAALVPETEVSSKLQRLNLFFEKDQINPDEVMSRQEYLRQQRDKIIEIKKSTRTKQLEETLAESSATLSDKSPRPSSAQVARKLLQNDGSPRHLASAKPAEAESNNALQLRKTLAKRLKAEVVERH